ncbi:hypothetical protein BH09SUM1_BH09SUM1_33580 [soil metagenome]
MNMTKGGGSCFSQMARRRSFAKRFTSVAILGLLVSGISATALGVSAPPDYLKVNRMRAEKDNKKRTFKIDSANNYAPIYFLNSPVAAGAVKFQNKSEIILGQEDYYLKMVLDTKSITADTKFDVQLVNNDKTFNITCEVDSKTDDGRIVIANTTPIPGKDFRGHPLSVRFAYIGNPVTIRLASGDRSGLTLRTKKAFLIEPYVVVPTTTDQAIGPLNITNSFAVSPGGAFIPVTEISSGTAVTAITNDLNHFNATANGSYIFNITMELNLKDDEGTHLNMQPEVSYDGISDFQDLGSEVPGIEIPTVSNFMQYTFCTDGLYLPHDSVVRFRVSSDDYTSNIDFRPVAAANTFMAVTTTLN